MPLTKEQAQAELDRRERTREREEIDFQFIDPTYKVSPTFTPTMGAQPSVIGDPVYRGLMAEAGVEETSETLQQIFETWDKIFTALNRRMLVAGMQGEPTGKGLWADITNVLPLSKEYWRRWGNIMTKPYAETGFDKITEPVLEAVVGIANDAGKPELGVMAVSMAYGFDLYNPTSDRSIRAGMKGMAVAGLTPGIKPSDIPAQISPIGMLNFAGDVGVSGDWLLTSGLTKAGTAISKIGKLTGSKAAQALRGERSIIQIAGRPLVPRQVSATIYDTQSAFWDWMLGAPKNAGWMRRFAGKFSKHLGPDASVHQLSNDFYELYTRKRMQTGSDMAAYEQALKELSKKSGIDKDKLHATFSDVIETFGRKEIEPPTGPAGIFGPVEGAKLQQPAKLGTKGVVESGALKSEQQYGDEMIEWMKDIGKFGDEDAIIERLVGHQKPALEKQVNYIDYIYEGYKRLAERTNLKLPPSPYRAALEPLITTETPTLARAIKGALPELTEAQAKGSADFVDNIIQLGDSVLQQERAKGIPLTALTSKRMNYLLHNFSEEAFNALPKAGRRFLAKPSEKALEKQIFHPSLQKRVWDMTIKELNDLATDGQVYLSKGKIGLLETGKKLPKDAKAISKLLEDNPVRLAGIRLMRSHLAIAAKDFLDAAMDIAEMPGGTTLKQQITKNGRYPENWKKTFGTLGEWAETYAERELNPDMTAAILHGLGKMRGLQFMPKHPTLAMYDKLLNIWKPITLFLYPKYYDRNFIGALWNSHMGDALMNTSWVDSISYGRLSKHPMWQEALEHGVVGRSQFTADIERGIMFGGGKGLHIGSVGELQENYIRFSNYIHFKNEGYIPRIAARKTKELQFDYLDLTPWEWSYMRRIFPFYTWTRKNVPLQLAQTAEKPARAVRPLIAMKQQEPDRPFLQKITLPKWMKERFPMFARLNAELLLEDFWPLADLTKFESIPKALQEVADQVTPFAKIPFETFARTTDGTLSGWGPFGKGDPTGISIFTGRPIETYPGKQVNVWGVDMPAKVAHALKGVFRFVREVEKNPFAPLSERQSPMANWLQFIGIPYYENNQQQSITFRVKEIDRELEITNVNNYPEKYKQLSFEKIVMLNYQDKLLDPWRGGDRPYHVDVAAAELVKAQEGVDISALKALPGANQGVSEVGEKKYKLKPLPKQWELAAIKELNIDPTELAAMEMYIADATDEERKVVYLRNVIGDARHEAFVKGGVEIYQDSLNTITNLWSKDRDKTIELDNKERQLLYGAFLNLVPQYVDYIKENQERGGGEWQEYTKKLKTLYDVYEANTGKPLDEARQAWSQSAEADYQKLVEGVKLDKEGRMTDVKSDEIFAAARRYASDPIATTEFSKTMWDRWLGFADMKIQESVRIAAKNTTLPKLLKDKTWDKASAQLQNVILNEYAEGYPSWVRREALIKYVKYVSMGIDAGIFTKTKLKWFEDHLDDIMLLKAEL